MYINKYICFTVKVPSYTCRFALLDIYIYIFQIGHLFATIYLLYFEDTDTKEQDK